VKLAENVTGKWKLRSLEWIEGEPTYLCRRCSRPTAKSLEQRAKTSRSIRMQIVHALFRRLQRTREPTPEKLQSWAADVSHAVSRKNPTTVEAITTTRRLVAQYWKPYLKERNLRIATGRPRLDERNAFIGKRLAGGTHWPAMRGEVARNEGVGESEIPVQASLQRAYYRGRGRD